MTPNGTIVTAKFLSLPRTTSNISFCCFQWPEFLLNWESSFYVTHSYPATEIWTHTYNELSSSMSLFLTWLLHLLNGADFWSVLWEHHLFYWFQDRNLLVDDQNFKRGGSNIIKYQGGSHFFSFYQSNLMSHFVPVIPVSPATTLKERCLG